MVSTYVMTKKTSDKVKELLQVTMYQNNLHVKIRYQKDVEEKEGEQREQFPTDPVIQFI